MADDWEAKRQAEQQAAANAVALVSHILSMTRFDETAIGSFGAGKGRMVNLGTISPMTSESALARIVETRQAQVKALLVDASHPAAKEALEKAIPMTFKAYVRVVKERDGYSKAEEHFLYSIWDRDRHDTTLQGYVSYLCDLDMALANFITQALPVPLPAEELKRHSYIVGAAGAGKSELLKILIHEHITGGNAAVVVVDAHSDLCEQIARWPSVATDDRLVFISPVLFGDMVPCINPLSPPAGSDDRTREKIANRLSEVIGDICRGEGGGSTVRMVSLAKAALRVLLDRPGSTLHDFYQMLAEDSPPGLIEAGKKHHDEVVRWFFLNDWHGADYKAAKSAMRARLLQLLLHKDFRDMTCAPSTVPLYELVDAGKIILFSLGQSGSDSARVVGMLIVSLMAALGDVRKETGREDRRPVHIVLDECHNFVGPATRTILTELRKYGMHLTLANQYVKQLTMDDRDAVLSNSQIKILGRSDYAPAMLAAMGCDNDEGRSRARSLSGGVFLVKWGPGEAFLMQARSDYADDRNQITKSQWIALKADQRVFYRQPQEEARALPSPEQKRAERVQEGNFTRDLD
ncbi:type IV secretory system conjugative DNA transfer family protein [Agrobacterium tumefaciens]|uniref:DUF87 domain-containing protein n=3 Tax=Agrobacterium tumefaciens TaxID=358 RepID=A0AA44J9J1_AGRTU|nr:DUF87 domain-containing protein [Agrobacterium tumefaciens]NTB88045.1 DUF87 domain-containing protein [Agrobacterium tumefaciens]NTC29396.1 DUF87 domain-containing protein [Agrobacterium tumefaciens]